MTGPMPRPPVAEEATVTIRNIETDGNDIVLEHDDAELLFSSDDRIRFGRRWRDIQSLFVDDPRQAVESADHLVVDMTDHIADRVAAHRSALARERAGERTAETEDLRQAIRRYRTLFHRLLSA
jgi:hypothetical protein